MRLLVTGGAGFIGSTFVQRRLLGTGDHITVLDKLTYAGSMANLDGLADGPATRDRFRFVRGDIADQALVRELAREHDAIVNFAAESHVDRSILAPTAFLQTGVLGLHSLLESARICGQERGMSSGLRLVQVSTDEVYGHVAEGRSREDDALQPSSPYSAAKAAGDLLCLAWHSTYGLDVVITRGANTYGPGQHPEKLIPLFVTNALSSQPLPLYGDGRQTREWLFVDDHAEAVSLVLDRGLPGSVYNVPGDGRAQANRDVTRAILEILGQPWSMVRSVPDRPGHDRRYALEGSRLRDLGWKAQVPFEEGLALTVRWYRDNPQWWLPMREGEFADYYERQYGWRLEASSQA